MRYEIRVEGVLDQHWSGWFEGLDVSTQPGGTTVISGRVTDQAALHGVLARIRDLSLVVIEVRRLDPEPDGGAPGDEGAGDST